MKILIISPNDNTGGTERVASIYFRVLSKYGHNIKICNVFKSLNSFGVDEFTKSSESLLMAKKNRYLRPIILYFYLIRMQIKGYSILLQGEYSAAISFFIPFKVYIRITNDISSINKNQTFLRLFFKLALRRHFVIAPHKKLLPNNLVSDKRAFILPNPLEESSVKEFSNINNINFIQKSKILNFISVGQLNYQKDHHFLLDTLRKIELPKGYKISLDIFGLGIEENNLNDKIADLGLIENVNLMGWSDKPWHTKNYIGHLLTSRWEGYPNVVLESACNSIPTLAIPIPPCTTDVIKDNYIGLVALKRKHEDYAKLIELYIYNLTKNYNYDFQFKSFIDKHNPLLLIDVLS